MGTPRGSFFSRPSLAGDFYDPTLVLQYGEQVAIIGYSDTRGARTQRREHSGDAAGRAPGSEIIDRIRGCSNGCLISSTTFHPILGSGIEVFESNDVWRAQYFLDNSFYTAQAPVEQRVSAAGAYPTATGRRRTNGRDKLSTRRFAGGAASIAVARRTAAAAAGYESFSGGACPRGGCKGTTRVFDMYVVTLRRTAAEQPVCPTGMGRSGGLPNPADRELVIPRPRPRATMCCFRRLGAFRSSCR